MDEETVAHLNEALMGVPCSKVEFLSESRPILHFGQYGLYIASPWRAIHEGWIVAGTFPDEDTRKQLQQLLIGQKIQKITIDSGFHDLHIQFENGVLLETFSHSGKFEHWHLIGATYEMIIAGPGDSLSICLGEAW